MTEPPELDVEEIDVPDIPEPEKPDDGVIDERDTYYEGDGDLPAGRAIEGLVEEDWS
jgi:hypothetical protein